MATGATIQSVLADALTNDISFADMAVLVKRAIVNALISGSNTCQIPISSGTVDGVEATMTLQSAQELLDFCLKRAAGGVVPQWAEFKEPPRTPWIH